MRAVLFVASNLGITLGYLFLAAVVVPRISVHLKRTRYGGMVFFLTCGMHHLDNVFHYVFSPNAPVAQIYVEWHMLLIDLPQVVAVWVFVSGLYLETVRWGPWTTEPATPES